MCYSGMARGIALKAKSCTTLYTQQFHAGLELYAKSNCLSEHHDLNFCHNFPRLADNQTHVTTRHRANERDAFTLPLNLGQ